MGHTPPTDTLRRKVTVQGCGSHMVGRGEPVVLGLAVLGRSNPCVVTLAWPLRPGLHVYTVLVPENHFSVLNRRIS